MPIPLPIPHALAGRRHDVLFQVSANAAIRSTASRSAELRVGNWNSGWQTVMGSPNSRASPARSQRFVRAIEDGAWTPSLKQRLGNLEQRRKELEADPITPARQQNLRLHPSIADLYRRKVEQLEAALKDASIRQEASGILRSMIERITLTPEAGTLDGLRVEVEGDLAAILAAASGKGWGQKCKDPVLGTGSTALPSVAGNRTQLYRTEVPGLFRTPA